MKNKQALQNERLFGSHAGQAEDRVPRAGVSPAFANGYGAASVMSRGDPGELIFRDDGDRIQFLETFKEVCQKTAWRVHAYTSMPNDSQRVRACASGPRASSPAACASLNCGTAADEDVRAPPKCGTTPWALACPMMSIATRMASLYLASVCGPTGNGARSRLIPARSCSSVNRPL